jgi:hypothetical protein
MFSLATPGRVAPAGLMRPAPANASTVACSSGGSGALTLIVTWRSGSSKLTLCACRNSRRSANRRICVLNSASPYFSSPATGCPA